MLKLPFMSTIRCESPRVPTVRVAWWSADFDDIRLKKLKIKYWHFLCSDRVLGFAWHIFLWFFWAVLSRHKQVPRMQRWKGQSSPHTVVNWKGSGGISAADLAGKYSLRAAILSLDSVPGLGASGLGWGAAELWHYCPARAQHGMDAFCAPEEENTVAVTVGGHTSPSTGRETVSGVSPLCTDSREGSQGSSDLHSAAQSRSSRAKHKENHSPGPQLGLPWHYPTLFEEGKSLVTTSTFCSLNLSCKN